MSGLLRSPFVSALGGGAVVAVALLVFGVGGSTHTRTVVQQAAVGGASNATRPGDGPLTPHDIYKRVAPGVVFVRSMVVQQVESPFDVAPQSSQASGSGFVVDKAGRILTNYHVVAGAASVTVAFARDRPVKASVVGTDPSNDLALLKVDPKGLKLRPLALGRSDSVQVGDPTLAIGNPFGLDRTLTSGIVSALQRRIQAPNGFTIDHVIQTDAAINPGNSGGPLLDATGRVVGINSQIETGDGSQGNVGIGFAVPIDTAKSELSELERTGGVARAYMGVEGVTLSPDTARAAGVSVDRGVLVESVRAGGPAAHSGLRGGRTRGDVITAIDGRPVTTIEDMVNRVGDYRPGDSIRVTYRRPGSSEAHSCTVRLGKRPAGVTTG